MADDDRLLRELKFLGIDETTVELLALLPLVQVAWADGTVQDGERELILELARSRYHLTPDATTMLEDWLSHPPSERYLARGRRALIALAHEREDFDLDPKQLDDVVEFSKAVAKAAGGFMGFRTIDLDEALALEDIAAALHVAGSEVDRSLVEEEEDVDDEKTDFLTPDDMDTLRDAAFSARSPRERSLAGEALADLVHHGSGGGEAFAIDVSGLTIGRSAVNDVQIQHDGRMSRVHCRIVHLEGRFYAEDNATTNGTWVNGERVSKRRLYGGEQLTVGGAHFTFMVR
ncbi:MAG: FHA domain-containing protein [Alphaproteobacteria bacterium]|nr:FHA domain-containing protein [Alphaproteobacteria bacterium]